VERLKSYLTTGTSLLPLIFYASSPKTCVILSWHRIN